MAPNADTDAADQEVIRALAGVSRQLKVEREERRRATLRLWAALAMSVIAGTGVLLLAGVVYRNAQRIEREARANAVRIEREAVARNVALCEEGNRFRGDVGGLLGQLLDLGAVADGDLPVSQRAAAAERRARARELGARAFAPKDCAAIAQGKRP